MTEVIHFCTFLYLYSPSMKITGTFGDSKCILDPLCMGNFPAGGVVTFAVALGELLAQVSRPSSNVWEPSLCSETKIQVSC